MPNFKMPIPDNDETVLRPVIYDVVRAVADRTQLTIDKNAIIIPGPMGKAPQSGSTMNNTQVVTPKLGSERQVLVSVEEEFDPDRLFSSAVFRPENLYIFRDDRLDTLIRPIYAFTNLTISFEARFRSKVEAKAWRDNIRRSLGEMAEQHVFSINYSYLVPREMLYMLGVVYTLREKQAGYGESYETWFKECSTERLTLLSTQDGKKGAWAIAETQSRCVGYFDFTGVPEEGQRGEGNETWTISFSYKFSFDKPVGCIMAYPLMVHNQLIPARYRLPPEEMPPYKLEDYKNYFSLSGMFLHAFEAGNDLITLKRRDGLSIPLWDEFIPHTVQDATSRLFTVMIKLDPNDLKDMVKLDSLEEAKIDPDVLRLLKKEVKYILDPYSTIFVLSFYEHIYLLNSSNFTIDTDLNVKAKTDLNLRTYYHVRLSLVNDLTKLSDETLKRLCKDGAAMIKIIDTIYPWLWPDGKYPKLDDGVLPWNVVKKIIDTLNPDRANRDIYQFNTVQLLQIEARPADELNK